MSTAASGCHMWPPADAACTLASTHLAGEEGDGVLAQRNVGLDLLHHRLQRGKVLRAAQRSRAGEQRSAVCVSGAMLRRWRADAAAAGLHVCVHVWMHGCSLLSCRPRRHSQQLPAHQSAPDLPAKPTTAPRRWGRPRLPTLTLSGWSRKLRVR